MTPTDIKRKIYVRNAVSPAMTLLLGALLLSYLAVVKLCGWNLLAEVMVILAGMTIVHGSMVILIRIWWMAVGEVRQLPKGRVAALLDVLMIAGIIATFSLGLFNYLLGFYGFFDVMPGGEAYRLGPNIQLVRAGEFSKPDRHSMLIRSAAFVRSQEGRDYALRLDIGSDGDQEQLLLLKGKRTYQQGLWLEYNGDRYVVALMVQRGTHDYLPAAVILKQIAGKEIYGAPLNMTEPGASGEVTLDPVGGIVSATIRRNGVVEYEGPVGAGKASIQDQMRLQVTATSHFGRVLVNHRNYRKETLAAFGFFLIAGICRLVYGMTAGRRRRDQIFPSCH